MTAEILSLRTHSDKKQIGGNHYKGLVHEPNHLAIAYDLGALEFSIVKYVTRHRSKAGLKDLRKGLQFSEKLVEVADQLIATRSKMWTYKPINERLTAIQYCSDNNMGELETEIVVHVCRWHEWMMKSDAQHVRNTLLELITAIVKERGMLGGSKPILTDAQKRYFRFIRDCYDNEDHVPGTYQCSKGMGLAPNAASDMYPMLEGKAVIERNALGGWKRGANWDHYTAIVE